MNKLMQKEGTLYRSEIYIDTDIGKLKIVIHSGKSSFLQNILEIKFYLIVDKTEEKEIFNKSTFLRIDEGYKIYTLVGYKEQTQYIRKYLTLDVLGNLIVYTSGL
jgi:hypothetical protein